MEYRFYIKIEAGSRTGGNPCVYHNGGFSFEQFMRWMWYFEYRAALLKVSNPKWKVQLTTGKFDYLPPKEQRLKSLKDKISGKKRTVTKVQKALILAKTNWQDLFLKIEETEEWKKVTAKLERTKNDLEHLTTELRILNN